MTDFNKRIEELAEDRAYKNFSNQGDLGTRLIYASAFIAGANAARELMQEQTLTTIGDANQKVETELSIAYLKIEELQEKLDVAVKAIEFYADRDNWSVCNSQTTSHMIGPDDHDSEIAFSGKFHAGRAARIALNKIRGENK